MERLHVEFVLDMLRTIGDPTLERADAAGRNRPWMDAYVDYVRRHGLSLFDEDASDAAKARARANNALDGLRRSGSTDLREVLALPDPRLLQSGANSSGVSVSTGRGEELRRAQELFSRYGNEIAAALLLAALPQSYAAGWGARVLTSAGGLTGDLRRRVRQTAQFLALVMTRPAREDVSVAWAVQGRAWRSVIALRLFHASLRHDLVTRAATDEELRVRLGRRNVPQRDDHRLLVAFWPSNVPLNQEDLLGMLLSFTITVFEVLERFGVAWTRADQEAYFTMWDYIGLHLGVGDAGVVAAFADRVRPFDPAPELAPPFGSDPMSLRPTSIEEARDLLEVIRDRQWRDETADDSLTEEWESRRPGRLLVEALLDELEAAMPRSRKTWPLTVMRQLAPAPVRNRLALGGGGLVEVALHGLPPRRVRIGRFTEQELTSRLGCTVLRMMANDVARNSVIRFLGSEGQEHLPPFVIPGLEDWTDGLVSGR